MWLMVTKLGREHVHCHGKFQNVCSSGAALCGVPLCLQRQVQCPPQEVPGWAGAPSAWGDAV